MKRIIKYAVITLCLAALVCLVMGWPSLGLAQSAYYEGMDVSRYQGEIDFNRAAKDGIEMVYIRAGEGADYTDPYYERNYAGAKAAGIKTGAYHFVTARSEAEARAQAAHFAALLAGKEFECRPAMDFEDLSGMGRDAANRVALAFLRALEEATGQKPALYSDAYRVESTWNASLSGYPLWIAEYDVDAPRTTGAWPEWSGWQYTDRGRVDGVEGNVDRDRFTARMLADNGETPPECPDVTATYIVQRGDTLSRIARSHDTTVSALAAANNIQNPNRIYVGQRLVIPLS